jgi:hypothetical protein
MPPNRETSLEVFWDSGDLAVWRNRTVDKALFAALGKSGSDAARALKVDSSRRLREKKRFKVRLVNRSLPLAFPKLRGAIADLEWTMRVSGEPSPVAAFPYRQTRAGINAMINRNKRTLIGGAFVATMKSGHTGVFMRKTGKRLPIREVFTTRVSDVFKDNGVVSGVYGRAQDVFTASFERLFPMELRKLK